MNQRACCSTSALHVIVTASDNKEYPSFFCFQHLISLLLSASGVLSFPSFVEQNHCQFSYNGHCHIRQQSRYRLISRFCQNCFRQFLCQWFGQIMVFNTRDYWQIRRKSHQPFYKQTATITVNSIQKFIVEIYKLHCGAFRSIA